MSKPKRSIEEIENLSAMMESSIGIDKTKIFQLRESLNIALTELEYGRLDDALGFVRTGLSKMNTSPETMARMMQPTPFDEMMKEISRVPQGIALPFIKEDGEESLYLEPGAITVLVGPSGHGKTTMSLNLALFLAKQEKKIYYLSYEESAPSLVIKALSAFYGEELSANNTRAIRSYLSGEEKYIKSSHLPAFKEAIKDFKALNDSGIFIVRDDAPKEYQLEDFLRRAAEHKAAAVFIDYIQLVNMESPGRSRHEEIKALMGMMNRVAKETGLIIVTAAQFNRTVSNPMKMDMRAVSEGSDIEKTANLIIGIWNTDKKIPPTEKKDMGKEWNSVTEEGYFCSPGYAYCRVLKSREAPGGEFMIPFSGNARKISIELGEKPADIETLDHQRDSIV